MSRRAKLKQAKRIVVKVGSSLLTKDDLGLNTDFIADFCRQLANLRSASHELLLVTSGAVAAGLPLLGWTARPRSVADFHVAAAVGQLDMFMAYKESLSRHGITPAQLLTSAEELAGRATYLNSRAIVRRLFVLGLLPVVNENDAVAMSERRFGDNDRLAAVMANLIEADLLIILTDVQGVHARGKISDAASIVQQAAAGDQSLLEHVSSGASPLGSGGMKSKLASAATAARGGADTVIASGKTADILAQIMSGQEVGTLLWAAQERIRARKLWLSEGVASKGVLHLDAGAVAAVCAQGRSLLPVGVSEIAGKFRRGDLVDCVDEKGKLVARGMVNYDSQDVARLLRVQSSDIEKVLGYFIDDEVIHRDNLAVLAQDSPASD